MSNKSFESVNCFQLFETHRESRQAHKKIKALIEDFAKKYKKLEKRYGNCGIGDTATDEAVSDVLYDVIHFSSKIDE